MKSAVFDIETTSLAAVGEGIVTVVVIRPCDNGRDRVFHFAQQFFEHDQLFGPFEREERGLLERVRDEIGKYQILIGHNIEKFDWPYLRSRAFQHNIDWNLYPAMYDTMTAFRRTKFLTRQNGFGKPTAGLAMVGDFFHVKQEKTSIFPVEWWMQIWGNDKARLEAVKEVVDHCRRDVRMNYAVYQHLWKADMKAIIRRAL